MAGVEDKAKRVAPMKATNSQICRMRSDHTDFGDFSLMTDGFTVWLSEQANGEMSRQKFEISKGRFNRLLRWYLREAKLEAVPRD